MIIEHNSHIELYRSPFGAVKTGESVTLRLGVSDGGVPAYVKLWYRKNNELFNTDMAYIYTVGGVCIYEAELCFDEQGLVWYYFEFSNGKESVYYANNEDCLGGVGSKYLTVPDKLFQITVYDKDYETPQWFKNTIVYQIFPDRFYNGNENKEFLTKREDIIKRNWGETPFYKAEQFGGEYKANDFFGGNFLGIEKKLPYLSELGIGTIYLNPIFKAYSNHRYDTGDYMHTDDALGSNEDFKRLIKSCNKYGIKLILDGVFNHTGSNSIYFNKDNEYDSVGAYQSEKSQYYDWFSFKNWPDEYDSWWGMKTLPSVNENSKAYRDFIINSKNSVVRKWLKDGASGWRLDVVDELPGFFVKELRKAVKEENPDAIIIGEVWEDASNKVSYGEQREYFLGGELDSVMNYPLKNALVAFSKNWIDAKTFSKRIMSIKENYPKCSYYSLLNFLSTHDVERILTAVSDAPCKDSVDKDFMANYVLGENEYVTALQRLECVVMMLMLMPGVPCIYYGDERGMQGYADPFCRACVDWDGCNEEIFSWYKKAISIRKSSDAFVLGKFEPLYADGYCYAFIRKEKEEKYIVAVNFEEEKKEIRLDVARFDISKLCGILAEENYEKADGIFNIAMEKNGIKVFMAKK